MDISALQQFIQLQAMSQMNASSNGDSTAPSSGTSDFSSLLSQALNGNSGLPNSNQTLGLMNGVNDATSANTNPLQMLSSLLGSLTNTLPQQNNELGSVYASSPTSMYSNYMNTYKNNALYTGTEAVTATKSTTKTPKTAYDNIITQASQTYGIPEKMIKAVIQQESGFNAKVTSSAGAGGLMQLMPATAKYLGVTDVYDPQQNIMAGTKYLKQMFDQFGDYSTMLAAYNAGPGNVNKYGGIPPFTETQNYVNKIMTSYKA